MIYKKDPQTAFENWHPFLTEPEIDMLPEIKRMRIGKEPVPRAVLFVARRLPITREDIRWAKKMTAEEK